MQDEELKKSIERARLRRAEEERRLSEQTQAVCAEKLRLLNLRKESTLSLNANTNITNNENEQPLSTSSIQNENESNTIKSNTPGYLIRPPPNDMSFSSNQRLNNHTQEQYQNENQYNNNEDTPENSNNVYYDDYQSNSRKNTNNTNSNFSKHSSSLNTKFNSNNLNMPSRNNARSPLNQPPQPAASPNSNYTGSSNVNRSNNQNKNR